MYDELVSSRENFCKALILFWGSGGCPLPESCANYGLTMILLKNLPSIRNLEGRCLQRLEASETPLGAASDSPPLQSG
jgi:hypothetical protein